MGMAIQIMVINHTSERFSRYGYRYGFLPYLYHTHTIHLFTGMLSSHCNDGDGQKLVRLVSLCTLRLKEIEIEQDLTDLYMTCTETAVQLAL